MPMPKAVFSPQQAKRYSATVLTLIVISLLAVGIFNLGRFWFSQRVQATAVPYGLPEGTIIGSPVPSEFPLDTKEQRDWETARKFLTAGQFKEALSLFQALLLKYPDSPDFLAGKALCQLAVSGNQGNLMADIEGVLALLTKRHPESAATFHLQGQLALQKGQNTLALEYLEKAVEVNPLDAIFRSSLANAMLKQGQARQAATEARTAISLSDGKDSPYYALLATSLHDQGSLDSCAEVVEFAYARYPTDPDLIVLSGWLKEYEGSFDMAEQLYTRALAINPEHERAKKSMQTLGGKSPPGSTGKGVVTPRERAQIAIDILEPLVSNYEENMPLRYALGQAYLKARLFDLAKEQFEHIAENDPEYPDIQLRIQEAQSAAQMAPAQTIQLTQELQKGLDSLRGKSGERSFSERLGHYLVRWGASPKEFFARYPQKQFQQIDSATWEEVIWETPLEFRTRIRFHKGKGLQEIRLWVTDTTWKSAQPNRYYDLFGRLLGQNSRISGNGTATGESNCDGLEFQGVVWESKDNFEILAQLGANRNIIHMLRLDPKHYQTMPRLCALVESLRQ